MTTLRDLFLLDPNVTFLNHGSFGATPRPVFEEYQRWQSELEKQPVEFLGRRCRDLMDSAREELAGYLHTSASNLVFVINATVAVNLVAHSLNLGPGDEVLATTHEYGACDRTFRFLASKRGFRYINQPLPIPFTTKAELVEAFWHGVSSNTRLIFISHITSSTAVRFPVELVVEKARNAGVLVLVDGAHAPGQIPLDLDALGADFYAGNLHKWLCAPKGSGFLYARPEVQAMLEPLVVSWGYEPDVPARFPLVERLEFWGTRDIAAFLSVPRAISFQQEHGWEHVQQTCHQLVRTAQHGVVSLTGIPAHHPDSPDWFVQMASAPLPPGTDIARLKSRLYEDFSIEVPVIEWNSRPFIRVSVQGYNTEEEIDKLLKALEKLLKTNQRINESANQRIVDSLTR